MHKQPVISKGENSEDKNSRENFGGLDYLRITLFGLAANAIWQCLHIVMMPLLVLNFVVASQKNTYLGLLTFCGLFLAMITQPVIGAISDRFGFSWGQRRPYILLGTIISLLLLPAFGLAGKFLTLLLVYCLFQIALNAAYVPYQAFIPDMVPGNKRGMASGIKGLMEMLGIVIFIYPVSLLMDRYFAEGDGVWLGGSLGLLEILLLIALVLTILLIHEPAGTRESGQALMATLRRSFTIDLSKSRSFLWFLISRLLVFAAFTTLQQFALNFLMDVTGVDNPAVATAKFSLLGILGIVIIIWPAGYITDKIGRKPVTIAACILGSIGIAIIYFSQNFNVILLASAIIGIAVGSFYSANWALATDLVPRKEEARYLGVVNIATAGGATLARLVGPLIDLLNNNWDGWGYRAMLLICILFLITGSMFILKIKTQRF